jgi:phosphoglucosamine mutase
MKYFGTDGIRGEANELLSGEFALKVGQAIGCYLQSKHKGQKMNVLIGGDTRESTDMLANAIAAGLASKGINVTNIGIAPTPAIAYLTKNNEFIAGIVISASHNPYQDNGIKIFGHDGYKLSKEDQETIENNIDNTNLSKYDTIGNIDYAPRLIDQYVNYLIARYKHKVNPANLGHITIDCAHGAAVAVAPKIFNALKLNCAIIFNTPDGRNINKECGSTHLDNLKKSVSQHKSDIGVAFDGDCDRFLALDKKGKLIDGDHLLYLFAKNMQADSIVATVMTNMGIEKALEKEGVKMYRSAVGDQNVMEMMKEKKTKLGGEQSGHIIFSDINTTGDGFVSALELLVYLSNNELEFNNIKLYNQKLINIKVKDKSKYNNPDLQGEIKGYTEKHKEIRFVIRPSGTEPSIRVLSEAVSQDIADSSANELKVIIEKYMN